MSDLQPDRAGPWLKGLAKRLGRLENSLGTIGSRISRQIVAQQRVFVQLADPAPTLPPGVEYVWYQTDGAGNLLQTVVSRTPLAGG